MEQPEKMREASSDGWEKLDAVADGRDTAGAGARADASATVVIELRVRNHPGAMSHITGLFARRAFNLEAIFCAPDHHDAGATSHMLLLVAEEPRLDQVERQLAKLYDVIEVRQRGDLDREFFMRFIGAVPTHQAVSLPH